MRSENEDQCLALRSEPEDTTHVHKKSKLSYSRDFLFSIARFDTCKKLPTGFDSSILRELDDQSNSMLHSHHDSDASRFQSSLSHCSNRNPEQGLLGSGAFARVHRDVIDTFVPVVQSSGFHLLNRSSEPYRPPHLCKEKYYSGRESKDHYNDETFGSPHNLSQDREEKEKMRRDSFELMRKEQEMVTQEKQKTICHDLTENLNPYISEPNDVKEDHSENPLVCFSDLTHQLAEAGKKTAGAQKVIEYDTTKFSFGTIESGHNLMKSAPFPVTKETSMELYGHCNPGVISYESLEEPILLEINGHCSTQHHSLNGRSNYDVEDSKSSSSYYDEKSQNFLSLLRKEAGLPDMAESSKLNPWSLDKSHIPDTEIESNQLNKSGGVCINKFEKNPQGVISRTLARDSQSTALTGTRKDLTSMFKWDDSVMSPIPLQENRIIPLTAKEAGSTGDVEGIVFSSFLKQTGASKRSSDLLVSNIQAKEELDLQVGPGSNNSSLSSVDELEICLPDEDSLITVDDYILPQDSSPVAAAVTSSTAVNTFDRLSDYGIPAVDNRFDLAGSESPTPLHGSHDLMSTVTYFNSLHMQQSNPQLHHSQLKPVTARVSYSQESQKGSIIKSRGIKSYTYNLQPVQHFPTTVRRTPSHHLRAAATGFGQSCNPQLQWEVPSTCYFPPQQMYGLPRAPIPQRTPDERACYEQNPDAMFNSPLNFNRRFYNYLENARSRPSEMGIESNANGSSYFSWPSAGSVWRTD
ncbi:hypothetical protein HRI_005164600 [Hibiscus trionum]|uniref:Uncharacterized protein n=1 Tax=Hibiscus trionum TaxID=183268 RepID=A0A9W7JM53_HIBTR|nr:hypothetical protein HRI_005164600 [Hibiscus trionum]